jgi:hypothetical protein
MYTAQLTLFKSVNVWHWYLLAWVSISRRRKYTVSLTLPKYWLPLSQNSEQTKSTIELLLRATPDEIFGITERACSADRLTWSYDQNYSLIVECWTEWKDLVRQPTHHDWGESSWSALANYAHSIRFCKFIDWKCIHIHMRWAYRLPVSISWRWLLNVTLFTSNLHMYSIEDEQLWIGIVRLRWILKLRR